MEEETAMTAETEEEAELNIARRTRSHLKIDGFEAKDNLDFPDVDMSLYHNPDSEGDTEYKKFLTQCYSEELGTEAQTDDNDPEYVYNNDIFSHGWSFNLNEMKDFREEEEEGDESMNEINTSSELGTSLSIQQSSFNNNDNQFISLSTLQPVTSQPVNIKSPNKLSRKIDMFDNPEFSRVLNQQLRQSIQLITQTYLLTKNTTNMQDEAEDSKQNLEQYMKIFKNKTKPSNLLPALELVNDYQKLKELKSSIRLSWRPLPVPDTVKSLIRDNPHIFIYPSLKPQVAFSILPEKLIPKKPKINFTCNEDKLLAYALNEFKGEASQYAFIASLLMTAKTKTQISNHIKNIKRSPGNENNPIRLFYSKGELPRIDLDSDSHLVEVTLDEDQSMEFQKYDSDQAQSNMGEIYLAEPQDYIDSSFIMNQSVQLSTNNLDDQINPILEQKEDEQIEHHQQEQQKEKEQEEQQHQELNANNQLATEVADSFQEHDDLMNMCLDDLMAASTTISKATIVTANNSENNKNIKNLKLKKSMLNLMSHRFTLTEDMRDLIVQDFLTSAKLKLSNNDNMELLRLLTRLVKNNDEQQICHQNSDKNHDAVAVYSEISDYFSKINAPNELKEKLVLFLDLEQATKCGCAFAYLHWMRFFEFMQHVELNNDAGVDSLEKKLIRLVDALQKDDQHKIKLAIGNLVNKHPFLNREFDSLSLEEKPHPSLFSCEEDFDDITEPMRLFSNEFVNQDEDTDLYKFEHFSCSLTEEELSYASQACPCSCHSELISLESGQGMQHCGTCNLKFMKGRMYLVNKIKPILAEWSYTERPTPTSSEFLSTPPKLHQTPIPIPPTTTTSPIIIEGGKSTTTSAATTSPIKTKPPPSQAPELEWTFEEDREILEFCRNKVGQSEETVSFDISTFQELVTNGGRQKKVHFAEVEETCSASGGGGGGGVGAGGGLKRKRKTAQEMADRFNHLMDLYKREDFNVSSSGCAS